MIKEEAQAVVNREREERETETETERDRDNKILLK